MLEEDACTEPLEMTQKTRENETKQSERAHLTTRSLPQKGSSAWGCGLLADDVITHIDDAPVMSSPQQDASRLAGMCVMICA